MPKRKKRDEKPRRRRAPRFFILKKKCRFCVDKKLRIHHLDHQLLRKFVTERGKITPSRITGSCAKHQRKLTNAIKRARNAGLLPFLAE
jgi:small subunit ribosomal protein S18